MKKLVVITIVSFTTLVFSQEKTKFGVHTGVNYSNFRGYEVPEGFDDVYSESPAFGFLIGVGVEYQLSNKLSLKVELNYERKNQQADNVINLTSFDGPTETYKFTSKKTHNYLVLPILLKYKFAENNGFYINGGTFVGYLQNSKLSNDANIPDMPNSDIDTTNSHKKIDFGFLAGVGKEFDINKGTVTIEIRNSLGLIDTAKHEMWNGGSLKTNSLALMVGYNFN